MGKKEAYLEKQEARFRRYSAEIDKLAAQADEAKADARIKFYEEIEVLQARRNAARLKLDELKAAGGEAWKELTGGVELAWQDLKDAVRDAASPGKPSDRQEARR
jgi:hypothetical protein